MEDKNKSAASSSSEDFDSWTLIGTDNRPLITAKPSQDKDDDDTNENVGENKNDSMNVCQENTSASTTENEKIVEKSSNIENIHDESEDSDGISVISESDGSGVLVCSSRLKNKEFKLHENLVLQLKNEKYEQLVPPCTPAEIEVEDFQIAVPARKELRRQSSQTTFPPHPPPTTSNWITFGVLGLALAGILLGNSMRMRGTVIDFNAEHEKRISELELENTILKDEVQKLKEVYTQEEQNQQTEKVKIATKAEEFVKRKIVWAGDDDDPLFIPDKKFHLPEFCYTQNAATNDDLFNEQQAAYCDNKQKKIEGKIQKNMRNNKKPFVEKSPINAPSIQQRELPNVVVPTINLNYQEALDSLKHETNTIVEALGSLINSESNLDADDEMSEASPEESEVEKEKPKEQQPQEVPKVSNERFSQQDRENPKSFKKNSKDFRKDTEKIQKNPKSKDNRKEFENKDKRPAAANDKINSKPKEFENKDEGIHKKRDERKGETDQSYLKHYEKANHQKDQKREKKTFKKEDDWNENRMKGREESRKTFEKDSAKWHENMMKGREESRNKRQFDEEREKNWYLTRGKQRDNVRSESRRR